MRPDVLGTYLSLDGIVAILFGGALLAIVLFRNARNGEMSFLDWSLLFIGLIYGFSAPLVIHAVRENPLDFVGAQFLLENEGSYSIHTIVVVIATLGLCTGWGIATSAGRSRRRARATLFSGVDDARLFRRAFWAMLIVAVVAQILYSFDYGGLAGAIDYARLVRSGLVSEVERSRFSFLRPIAGFALLAAYGFLGLLLSGRHRRSVGSLVGFIAAFFFSLFILNSWQGRLGTATFIAVLLLTVVLSRGTRSITLIFGFVASAVVGMYGVYLISELWELKTSGSFSAFYVKEISFIFTGFWAEWSHAESTWRFFYDVLVLPLFVLPSSWTVGWFENVQDVHTATMLGAAKGQAGVTTGMPLDFVTVGFLQLNVLGVFFFALLFGIVLRCLQTMVQSIELPGIKAALTAYIALRVAGFGLFYAHPEQLVASNYPLIITLIVMLIFRGRKTRADTRVSGGTGVTPL